jgi:enamine deaminase RidA (YjgF/YER057c/UK114 family)
VSAHRRSIASGSPWEERFGYSRAVVVGDRCWVAGTADATRDHPGDPAGQARAALGIIERALIEAGFRLGDVVRTRMYVTDPAHTEAVATVHGEVFRDIRPTSTLLVVAGLVEPDLLVEIEADAIRG